MFHITTIQRIYELKPRTKLAALYSATKSLQNSCTAKLQLFSSGLQKRCAAFEGSLKLSTAVLQRRCRLSNAAKYLQGGKDYGFYNAKTLTVPLRNVSKLVRKEDHLLDNPPNSMLSINFIP